MAIQAKVGQFSANTSTGNQAITGVGFQPTVIIFWMDDFTTDGTSTSQMKMAFGAATSSTDRRFMVVYSPNASTSQYAGLDNTKCIGVINSTPGWDMAADFVSMDSDGFTINITTASGAYKINYMAINGTTNVTTGQFTKATVTGNQSISGLGFQPDCVLFIGGRDTTTVPPSVANSPCRLKWGIGISPSSRGITTGIQHNPTGSSNVAKRYQRSDKCYASLLNDGSGVNDEADFVSLDSGGFTINWTTASPSAQYVFYIAIKGGVFSMGTINQPGSTGNQSVGGLGQAPVGIILSSFNNVSATTIQSIQRFSFGMGTSSSARACHWQGSSDGGTSSSDSEALDTTKIIKMYTETTPTLNAAADLSSLDSNGFTINWTTVDSTAREVLYLAIGNTPSFTFQQLVQPNNPLPEEIGIIGY